MTSFSLSINVFVYFFLPGDGYLVFSDFVKTLEDYKRPDDQNDLIMAFRVFDPENKGFVEAKEMKKAVLRLKDIAKEEIEVVLEAANLEDHRHIYFEGQLRTTDQQFKKQTNREMRGQQNKNRNSAPEAKSREDQGWSSNYLAFQIKIERNYNKADKFM